MRPVRLILPALIALAVLPAPAAAVVPIPTWATEQLVSPIGEQLTVDPPLVVMHADGGVTTVWLAAVAGPALQLRSAHLTPGGSWQEPVDVGAPGSSLGIAAQGLTVAPNGEVTVVWTADVGDDTLVYTAARSASTGAWGAQTLLSLPGLDSLNPVVQAASDSSVWAAWSETAGGGTRTLVGHRPAGSLEWTKSEYLSADGGSASRQALAVAPNGDVAVNWVDGATGLKARVLEDGSWSEIEPFGSTCGSGMAFTPSSTLVLAYGQCVGGDTSTWSVLAHTRQAHGSFSAATEMSSIAGRNPTVAATSTGDIVVTWTRTVYPDPPALSLAGRVYRAGSGWGPESGLNGTVVALSGTVVALPNGTVLFPQLTGPSFGAMKPGVQTWLPEGVGWQVADQVGVGNGGSVPQLAQDGIGNAVTVWQSQAHDIRSAISDGASPQLTGLTIPQAALTGAPTEFSVAPTDWSPPLQTSWSFGDGDAATGTSATHTFNAPGTYTVSVTSTDALNKTTTGTRTITVTDPIPPATTPPPATLAPTTPEVRLKGRTLTVAAKVTLKRNARCRGTVKATATGARKAAKLRLRTVKGACIASGTITLKKAAKAKTKVVVKITGRTITARRLAATRA